MNVVVAVRGPRMAKKRKPGGPAEGELRPRIDLRVTPELRRRIERQTQRFNIDMTDYITRAVVHALEADEATDPQLRQAQEKGPGHPGPCQPPAGD